MRVLYVQYTNPGAYPPLVRGAQLIAETGATVRMLGTQVRGLEALDVDRTDGISVDLVEAAGDGWRLKAHYACYAAWVTREAAAWKPDWVYASDLFSAPIALAVGRLTGARIVYHEHDAPVHERPSWFVQRCLDARRLVLRSADLVVAPNAERGRRLASLAGEREVLTVWNCPRRPTTLPERTRSRSSLRVIFRGSVNPDRLPLTVVDALAELPPVVSLAIAGYETAGSRGYLGHLAEHARAVGVGDRVRHLGTIPERELAAVCQNADVGLALMPMRSGDENMRNMTGASNKVFEYLAYGIAPIVSDLPDWRQTFVEPGYALACDPTDATSIAGALGTALANGGLVDGIAANGWQRLLEDWNYETQFAPVLAALGAARSRVADHTGATREEVACAS